VPVATLSAVPFAAFAQETTAEPEKPAEVTVTGSRIARPETEFPNPVVSVSSDAI
jgi:hypothetical protein